MDESTGESTDDLAIILKSLHKLDNYIVKYIYKKYSRGKLK